MLFSFPFLGASGGASSSILRSYSITQWSFLGSMWEMSDLNWGPLTQKSGAITESLIWKDVLFSSVKMFCIASFVNFLALHTVPTVTRISYKNHEPFRAGAEATTVHGIYYTVSGFGPDKCEQKSRTLYAVSALPNYRPRFFKHTVHTFRLFFGQYIRVRVSHIFWRSNFNPTVIVRLSWYNDL